MIFVQVQHLVEMDIVMTESDFIHILNEVKPYTNYLYFHLLGEPFLNPRIGRFLELSHEAGMQVNLTTNGTLIKKVEDLLIQSPALRQINFSIHSFEANEQNTTLEEYLLTLLILLSEFKRLDLFIVIFVYGIWMLKN